MPNGDSEGLAAAESPPGTVYLNGSWVEPTDAVLPIDDFAITSGVTITEIIRTFRHKPFRLDAHLDRFEQSAKLAHVPLRVERDQLAELIAEAISRRGASLTVEHDLTVSVFASPGRNRHYDPGTITTGSAKQEPTLCVYAFPIRASRDAVLFELGQHLIVPSIEAVPPGTLSPKIKTRNRLHWYLAEHEAARSEPGARSLLVRGDGVVTETAAGCLFAVIDGALCEPPRDSRLDGISAGVVRELAVELGLTCREVPLQINDLLSADEIFTASTVYCLLPVTRLNGSKIGDETAGPIYHTLLGAWNKEVGVDIANQFRVIAELGS
ncbi:aminotransferase class IV [Stratiformator vulcanicus]|uniref:branched-chain-amino-acid transaminase n=1 Tax=Stratiformator vulcanicus TaxID=2527980 RepID=A0A517R0C3_9PLAN|nr:aminotransferase class IV [Stratiformator vulcanicus]QDT37283.1 Branched-chain-amino-acid aminotransferase [Stratiformator vulcanicus]